MKTTRRLQARRGRAALVVVAALMLAPSAASARGAWPGYRCDNARSGFSPEPLPTSLHVQWAYVPRHAPRPAWPEPGKELHRMAFDYACQVAVADGLVFFGSSADHKVYALDLETGAERWSFFTEGPIRFAPAVSGRRVFVASDDGCVYCLSAREGKLLWRLRGGPRDERLLGNGQMISRWPARAGVLVEGGTVYVAAGMWSPDAVYLYALRAADGSVVWKNDTCGRLYMELPHPLQEGLAGVAPQGYLALWKDTLAVANGRASPAGFDARTGRFLFCQNTLMKLHHPGSSWVIAAKDMVFSERRLVEPDGHVKLGEADPAVGEGLTAWHYRTGQQTLALVSKHRAVVAGDTMYASGGGTLTAVDLNALLKALPDYVGAGRADPTIPGRQFPWPQVPEIPNQTMRWPHDTPNMSRNTRYPWFGSRVAPVSTRHFAKWETPLGRTYALILAGNTLVAGGRGKVTAFAGDTGMPLWQASVDGQARGLAAADGRLLVSTTTGRILCFASRRRAQPRTVAAGAQPPRSSSEAEARAKEILKRTGISTGHCLVLGVGDGQRVGELARQSELAICCVEPDAAKVAAARRMLDAAGLYGVRVAVHHASIGTLPYADYFANLIVADEALAGGLADASATELYRVLRPCGGVAYVAPKQAARRALSRLARWLSDGGVPSSEIRTDARAVRVVRGALPGAGQWTHEYGDAGRSAASVDTRVRLPLRVLWFGGPGPARMVSRHWSAPAPLCVNGRMFVAGQHHVIGVDAYNGRELWCRELPGAGRFSAKYRGGNIVADESHVYALQGTRCLQLDAQTGTTTRTYRVPPKLLELPVLGNPFDRDHRDKPTGKKRFAAAPLPNKVEWEFLAVTDDALVGSVGLPNVLWTTRPEAYPEGEHVFALRKSDGKLLWACEVEEAVSPNAIAVRGGRVYLLDQTSRARRVRSKRRGEPVATRSVLKALDAATGGLVWKTGEQLQGTMLWMGGDVLLVTGMGKRSAYSARDGTLLWAKPIRGSHYPVIVGDTFYAYPCAYDLRTGEPRQRRHPLTGERTPWTIACKGGCGTLSGCPSMLFFRAGAAGFYDLAADSGLHYLGQVRSSCWLNTIAAGGMVLMPEGASSCTCPYNFQTSLALVPTTRHESWSIFPDQPAKTGATIRRLALNLGALGDRRDDRGTLWLAFPRPFRPGALMLPITTAAEPDYYRRNADDLPVRGTSRPWLYASGAAGLRRLRLDLALDRRAPAPACARPPKIDGRLDDACWDGKAPLPFATDLQAADPRAVAFLRHDDDNLYVGFQRKASVRDGKPVPWTRNTQGEDAAAWKDDSLNIRLGDGRRVLYLYVSASGATYDGLGTHTAGPRWDGTWTAAVHVTPERWAAEIAVPWKTLERVEFTRKNLSVYLESTNRTGVGPAKAQFRYRTWRRYGLFARPVRVAYREPPGAGRRSFRIVLQFAELDDVRPGQRIFDVKLQGRTVLEGLDVRREAGGRCVALVKEVAGVQADEALTLELVPRSGLPPILSALELHEQRRAAPDPTRPGKGKP